MLFQGMKIGKIAAILPLAAAGGSRRFVHRDV
jgi:hypothetical protein